MDFDGILDHLLDLQRQLVGVETRLRRLRITDQRRPAVEQELTEIQREIAHYRTLLRRVNQTRLRRAPQPICDFCRGTYGVRPCRHCSF